jgi:hypothetical protein
MFYDYVFISLGDRNCETELKPVLKEYVPQRMPKRLLFITWTQCKMQSKNGVLLIAAITNQVIVLTLRENAKSYQQLSLVKCLLYARHINSVKHFILIP